MIKLAFINAKAREKINLSLLLKKKRRWLWTIGCNRLFTSIWFPFASCYIKKGPNVFILLRYIGWRFTLVRRGGKLLLPKVKANISHCIPELADFQIIMAYKDSAYFCKYGVCLSTCFLEQICKYGLNLPWGLNVHWHWVVS